MDAGKFAKAYVAQKQVDNKLAGNDYDAPEALDYLECTAVEYKDVYVRLWSLVRMIRYLWKPFYLFVCFFLKILTKHSTMSSLDAPAKMVSGSLHTLMSTAPRKSIKMLACTMMSRCVACFNK